MNLGVHKRKRMDEITKEKDVINMVVRKPDLFNEHRVFHTRFMELCPLFIRHHIATNIAFMYHIAHDVISLEGYNSFYYQSMYGAPRKSERHPDESGRGA